jgi:anti-sigma B factor antagonist
MSDTLEIEADSHDSWSVLSLRGEVDISTVALLEERIDAALEGGSQLVLDLTGVSFIDSTGLRLVISTRQRLTEDGELALVVADGPVTRLLEITGLDGAFPVFATVEEATLS